MSSMKASKRQNFPTRYLKGGGYSPVLNYSAHPDEFYNYNAPGAFQPQKGGHWTDAGKLPGHPTFSNESIYANPLLAPRWHYEGGIENLIDPLTGEIMNPDFQRIIKQRRLKYNN